MRKKKTESLKFLSVVLVQKTHCADAYKVQAFPRIRHFLICVCIQTCVFPRRKFEREKELRRFDYLELQPLPLSLFSSKHVNSPASVWFPTHSCVNVRQRFSVWLLPLSLPRSNLLQVRWRGRSYTGYNQLCWCHWPRLSVAIALTCHASILNQECRENQWRVLCNFYWCETGYS